MASWEGGASRQGHQGLSRLPVLPQREDHAVARVLHFLSGLSTLWRGRGGHLWDSQGGKGEGGGTRDAS